MAFCSGPGPEPPTGPGALAAVCRLLSELFTEAPGVGVCEDGPTRPPTPLAGGPDEEEMSRVAGGSALLCCLDFLPKRNDMAEVARRGQRRRQWCTRAAQGRIRPAGKWAWKVACGAGSGCRRAAAVGAGGNCGGWWTGGRGSMSSAATGSACAGVHVLRGGGRGRRSGRERRDGERRAGGCCGCGVRRADGGRCLFLGRRWRDANAAKVNDRHEMRFLVLYKTPDTHTHGDSAPGSLREHSTLPAAIRRGALLPWFQTRLRWWPHHQHSMFS